MKMKIKILLAIILTLVLALIYYFFYKDADKGDGGLSEFEKTYYNVGRGDISSGVNILGNTFLYGDQKLKFNEEGVIESILVKSGDNVKKGDLLAKIDTKTLENEFKDAQIDYDEAEIDYEETLKNMTTRDKVKDRNNIRDLEISIKNKKRELDKLLIDNELSIFNKNLEIESNQILYDKALKDRDISLKNIGKDRDDRLDQITNKKRDIEDKKRDIEDKKRDIEKKKNDITYKKDTIDDEKWLIEKQISDKSSDLNLDIKKYNDTFVDLYDDIDSDLTSIRNSLISIDKIFGYEENSNGDIYSKIYFSAKSSNDKNAVYNGYWDVKGSLDRLSDDLTSLKKESLNDENLEIILNQEYKLFDSLLTFGDAITKGADNSIETEDFTASDVDYIRSMGDGLNLMGKSGKKSINNTIDNLKNLKKPIDLKKSTDIEIVKLNKQLDDLAIDLDDLNQEFLNLEISLDTLNNDLENANKDLKYLSGDLVNFVDLTPFKIEEIDLNIKNLKSNLDKSKLDLDEMDADQRNSIDALNLSIKDLEVDLMNSKSDFDKKYLDIENSKEIRSLKNILDQSKLALDKINDKIMNYEIRAPFDGYIDSINMKVGESIDNDKFIHIINPNKIEVEIKLDQIDITKVKVGNLVDVSFDSYPNKVFKGKIESIDKNPIDDGGMNRYKSKIIIDKGDLDIYSGMSAIVDIIFDERKDVILIPTMSIESDIDTGENYVTIFKDGKESHKNIEIGINNNGMTEVISGLEVGYQILEINFDANQYNLDDFTQGGMMW